MSSVGHKRLKAIEYSQRQKPVDFDALTLYITHNLLSIVADILKEKA